ncbi:DUF4365 domain-containing protein [Desulfovibrio subterraneus]|uniref:DUF4365 domain-containing protein n=1 Tax=Desulfovibrio subterraneus TaxID=2718620 RepID=A0A7J0BNS3_9BACT|nr:DUF4365 domain-containing protein [Desulfovibrio subterraneus]GFM34852.1 hypothetical protein DSM101010T_32170 [Desulfovibrio subterraneus]
MSEEKVVTAHRRILTHKMESDSKDVFKSILPEGWVVRNYDYPDYGIDQAVEVFDAVAEGVWVTAGEHLFIQVKSVEKCDFSRVTFEGLGRKGIDVIKFKIDTKTLLTAAKMSSAQPLMLILVCFEDMSVYYICLNDYIVACAPDLRETQSSKTIYIPIENRLTADESEIRLRFYSARVKLYALFSAIEFQYAEILYMTDGCIQDEFSDSENEKIKRFIVELLNNDIWNFEHRWGGISVLHRQILCADKYMKTGVMDEGTHSFNFVLEEMGEKAAVKLIWEQMSVLHKIYHQVILLRELPSEMEAIYA